MLIYLQSKSLRDHILLMLKPFYSVFLHLESLQLRKHGSFTSAQLVSILLLEALIVICKLLLDGLHIELGWHARRRRWCHLGGRLRGEVRSKGAANQRTR